MRLVRQFVGLFLPARSWLFLLTLAAHARSFSEAESPCEHARLYDAWLSDPEVFIRTDQPKGLQGLHVGCLWHSAKGSSLQFETYRDALRSANGPDHYVVPFRTVHANSSWSEFRTVLAEVLDLNRPTNTWAHQELKQVFGVFAAHGQRLRSIAEALEASLIFVIVGGQWFWPPVREGFVRELKGLNMQLETLSVAPVVFQVRGFLEDAECEEFVRMGSGRMESSPVVLMDRDKGKKATEFRTSSQARIYRSESETLRRVDGRVSRLTGIPPSHNEEIQILRYTESQYYAAHLDNWDPQFYSDAAWFEHGHNNRMITVFWYLTTVTEGGETIFPRAFGHPQPTNMWGCDQGLKVRPVKGTVIFWYSLHPNGNTDQNGLHAACPVVFGTKFSANYWVWNKPKQPNPGVLFAEPDGSADRTSGMLMMPAVAIAGVALSLMGAILLGMRMIRSSRKQA